jgi:hypothetical protein
MQHKRSSSSKSSVIEPPDEEPVLNQEPQPEPLDYPIASSAAPPPADELDKSFAGGPHAVAVSGGMARTFPPPSSIPPTLPPLGHVPTHIGELYANVGTKASAFSGPVVSGRPNANHLDDSVWGSAILALPLRIDYSMGNFTLPIQFPRDAILLGTIQLGVTAFTTAPTLSLDADPLATTTLVPIGAAPAAGEQESNLAVTTALPGAAAVAPEVPFQAFLAVSGNTGTAGASILLILFARVTPNWF